MNEDYYYSTDTVQEQNVVSSAEDYYKAAPLTRSQFIKSQGMKEKRTYFRILGIFAIICIVIDLIRVYRINWEYEIDKAVWLVGIAGLIITGLEIYTQINAYLPIVIIEFILSIIILWGCIDVTLMGLVLMPVGVMTMIALGYHISQTAATERKWKSYHITNK